MNKGTKGVITMDDVGVAGANYADYSRITMEEMEDAMAHLATAPIISTDELMAATIDELESLDMEAFAFQDEPEAPVKWKIADDGAADWAIQKIASERAELDRIKELAEAQIARIEEKLAAAEKRCENGTRFLTGKLAEYFATVPHKKTKTTESYRLLSGTLKMKLGGVSMKQDDAALVEFLKASGQTDFIKVTESVRWADFKKRLEIQGTDVVDAETGEIIDGVRLIEKPDSFVVEV